MRYLPFVVEGTSMRPALEQGDLILARRTKEFPKPGDVVVFRHREKGFPVVHRVTEVGDGFLHTRGDARSEADPEPTPFHEVLGTVWLRIPRLGGWIRALTRGFR